MPRLVGQIDRTKSEAILDAALAVLSERGLAAPLEEIARRACVSKQTIYNHYGSKAELIRALVERRMDSIVAQLDSEAAGGTAQQALTAFGRSILEAVLAPGAMSMVRLYVQGASDMPDLARAVFEAGPRTSRTRLAAFLAREHDLGRLDVPDPALAAEFFAGMVLGSHQMAGLLGVPTDPDSIDPEAVAVEAARRFLRAYEVSPPRPR